MFRSAIPLLLLISPLSAEKAVTLENHIPPTANTAKEAIAAKFSYQRAVEYTDHAAMDWQESHSCITCHTNGLYLATRHAGGTDAPAYQTAREFTRNYLKPYVVFPKKRTPKKKLGEHSLISSAAFLAISDIKSDGKLGEITKQALDESWREQHDTGAWNHWLKCDWGPYEVDDHFGASLMALALGMASKDPYLETEAATKGREKLYGYLKANKPKNLHQVGMTLWAASYDQQLASEEQVAEWKKKLLEAQRTDGGWNTPALGDETWKRSDGKVQSTESDAYATAFVVLVLREAGYDTKHEAVKRGQQWLRTRQRASGRWYSRSPHVDKKHYLSNAATNFAVAALAGDAK